MEIKNAVGRSFVSETLSHRDEHGYWMVTVRITEKATLDGANWVEETIEASSADKNHDSAHKLAMFSCLQELNRLTVSAGFDSLIEGREWDRANGTGNDNANTAS